MTINPGRTPLLLAVLAGLGAPVFAPAAHAWPTTSPSAKSAARLKYHPPDNWLQHYLPDDRYKIAGGIWKVVSTQYDTYYHRPDSQYMLRQPAGIVIGFASEQEAKEAGYRSAGGFGGRPSAGSGGGNASVTVGRGKRKIVVRGTRVTLSDGSSILLPDGWTLTKGGLQNAGSHQLATDFIGNGSDASRRIAYYYANVPGLNMRDYTSPTAVRNFVAGKGGDKAKFALTTSFVPDGASDGSRPFSDIKTTRISSTSFGGLSGVALRDNSKWSATSYAVGTGSKFHSFIMRNSAVNTVAARAIISSFRRA